MSSDSVVKVENLGKCYQIYDTPRDRLKQFFLPRVNKFLGLESKIYFREFWALQNISFEIKKGETVGVIGVNGSGKSTLLQMICGTLNPTIGNIETHGRIAALLELGSGFNPEFTGRENVFFKCRNAWA
jgi:lipopolysaccharide transport system ATP-binding protein